MARQPGERCSGGDFKDQMIEQGHIRMLVRIGPWMRHEEESKGNTLLELENHRFPESKEALGRGKQYITHYYSSFIFANRWCSLFRRVKGLLNFLLRNLKKIFSNPLIFGNSFYSGMQSELDISFLKLWPTWVKWQWEL